MKHVFLNPSDVKAMLRSGYAVRTAQQFEFLSAEDCIDMTMELSNVIRSGLPMDAVSSLWFTDTARRQLMSDIIDQIRNLRWPTFAAIEAVYNEVSQTKLETSDLDRVVTAFFDGYEMRYGNEFFAYCGERNIEGSITQGLWEAIVSVRNGDAVLPTVMQTLK